MIKLKSLLYEIEEPIPDEELVRKFAASKGYTHMTYRGDTYYGDIYNYSSRERREHGIFTTTIKEVAAGYSSDKKPRKFYVNAKKILNLMDDTMENMTWVNKWGEAFDDWRDPQSGEEYSAWDILSGGRLFDYEGNWSSERWRDIQLAADNQGYDAVVLPDYDSDIGIFPSFVIFDEKMLKLADQITYDDNNQIIPLQQRFNKLSDDIRY